MFDNILFTPPLLQCAGGLLDVVHHLLGGVVCFLLNGSSMIPLLWSRLASDSGGIDGGVDLWAGLLGAAALGAGILHIDEGEEVWVSFSIL